jgi:hypothetical protein
MLAACPEILLCLAWRFVARKTALQLRVALMPLSSLAGIDKFHAIYPKHK